VFKVLLTRSAEDCAADRKLFERFGFEVLQLPTLEFKPLDFDPPKERFDLVFFPSRRAIDFYLLRAKIPKGAKVAAVGQKSAEHLRKRYLVEPDFVLGGYSRDLFKLNLEGKRVLAVLPLGGGGELDRLKNASVEKLFVYETILKRLDPKEAKEKIKAADALIFASPSSFKALLPILQKERTIVEGKIIVAIGDTTERAIRRGGFTVRFKPSRPSMELLARELAEALYGTQTGYEKKKEG